MHVSRLEEDKAFAHARLTQAVVITPPKYAGVWSECKFKGALRSTATKMIIVAGRMNAASCITTENPRSSCTSRAH